MTDFLLSVPPLVVYVVVGLMIGIESIGIPVPGETALIAGAVMSTHPELSVSPWGVAVGGAIGAIVGDSIGYAIGHRYGGRLLAWMVRRFPSHLSDDHLAYGSHVFNRYGVFAVFGGRFVALLRIIAGPLAGALGMHYPRFLAANAAGGIAWAGGMTSLIVLIGEAAQHWLARGAWIALLVFIAAVVGISQLMARRIDRNVEVYAAGRRRAEGLRDDQPLPWGAHPRP